MFGRLTRAVSDRPGSVQGSGSQASPTPEKQSMQVFPPKFSLWICERKMKPVQGSMSVENRLKDGWNRGSYATPFIAQAMRLRWGLRMGLSVIQRRAWNK